MGAPRNAAPPTMPKSPAASLRQGFFVITSLGALAGQRLAVRLRAGAGWLDEVSSDPMK